MLTAAVVEVATVSSEKVNDGRSDVYVSGLKKLNVGLLEDTSERRLELGIGELDTTDASADDA